MVHEVSTMWSLSQTQLASDQTIVGSNPKFFLFNSSNYTRIFIFPSNKNSWRRHVSLFFADYCRTKEDRICLPKLYIDFDDQQVTVNHGASFSTSLVNHLTKWLLEAPSMTGSGGSKAALANFPSRLFHSCAVFSKTIENNKSLIIKCL